MIYDPKQNRRNYMRVKLSIDFCVISVSSTKNGMEDEPKVCFSTKTVDVSMGGVCITHNNVLKQGMKVELRTKNCLTKSQCLTCESTYFMDGRYEMQPMEAVVAWATPRRAGLKFLNLSPRNENIINKAVWEAHLKSVRQEKDQTLKYKLLT